MRLAVQRYIVTAELYKGLSIEYKSEEYLNVNKVVFSGGTGRNGRAGRKITLYYIINALTFNMGWKLKNIEMVINASAVLDMLGPFQCSRNDISPTRKSLKICNYPTVRLLPLLFRCG